MIWADRTTSERLSLGMLAFYSLLGLWLWAMGDDELTVKTVFQVGAFVTITGLSLICLVPASVAMLFLGGKGFASSKRRWIDKLLPLATFAVISFFAWLFVSFV
jgi:CBS domain containing-hemolysin-like protein